MYKLFQTVKLLCAMSMLLVVIPVLMGLTLDMIVTVPARVALNQTPLISLWQVSRIDTVTEAKKKKL